MLRIKPLTRSEVAMIAPRPEPQFVIEEVTDPAEIAASQARSARFKRNSDWLEAHWPDLMPQARGKFVAVAGQEAFLADTLEEARALVRRTHPDDAALVQYVRTGLGPRIYATRG